MTLTEILPAVRQLPALDKLRLIRILAEDLDVDEDISPLEPNKLYTWQRLTTRLGLVGHS